MTASKQSQGGTASSKSYFLCGVIVLALRQHRHTSSVHYFELISVSLGAGDHIFLNFLREDGSTPAAETLMCL